MRAMLTNLETAAEKRSQADKAVFYLQRIKEATGRSLQSILSDCVVSETERRAAQDATISEIVADYAKRKEGGV